MSQTFRAWGGSPRRKRHPPSHPSRTRHHWHNKWLTFRRPWRAWSRLCRTWRTGWPASSVRSRPAIRPRPALPERRQNSMRRRKDPKQPSRNFSALPPGSVWFWMSASFRTQPSAHPWTISPGLMISASLQRAAFGSCRRWRRNSPPIFWTALPFNRPANDQLRTAARHCWSGHASDKPVPHFLPSQRRLKNKAVTKKNK